MAIKRLYNKLILDRLKRSIFKEFLISVSAEDSLIPYKDEKSGKTVVGAPFIIELEPFGLNDLLPEGDKEQYKKKPLDKEAIQTMFDLRIDDLNLMVDDVKKGAGGVLEVHGKVNSNTNLAQRSISKKGMKTFNMMWIEHQLNIILSDIEEQDDSEILDRIALKLREVKTLLNEYANGLFE